MLLFLDGIHVSIDGCVNPLCFDEAIIVNNYQLLFDIKRLKDVFLHRC